MGHFLTVRLQIQSRPTHLGLEQDRQPAPAPIPDPAVLERHHWPGSRNVPGMTACPMGRSTGSHSGSTFYAMSAVRRDLARLDEHHSHGQSDRYDEGVTFFNRIAIRSGGFIGLALPEEEASKGYSFSCLDIGTVDQCAGNIWSSPSERAPLAGCRGSAQKEGRPESQIRQIQNKKEQGLDIIHLSCMPLHVMTINPVRHCAWCPRPMRSIMLVIARAAAMTMTEPHGTSRCLSLGLPVSRSGYRGNGGRSVECGALGRGLSVRANLCNCHIVVNARYARPHRTHALAPPAYLPPPSRHSACLLPPVLPLFRCRTTKAPCRDIVARVSEYRRGVVGGVCAVACGCGCGWVGG